ncbi:MAG: lipoyl(octanoyl) transferase LipB [Cytophagales bacterium]|nr:MAG: lipoyl(octanoyl) transferase LipB [Cytophagales bacterium]
MISYQKNNLVSVINLERISYSEAWTKQDEFFKTIVEIKNENRNNDNNALLTPNFILSCEHFPVYTIGKSGKISHLLIGKEELKSKGVEFFETNRGGDITFHGLGQLVIYPILDLENFFTDIHKYLRFLEESVILTLAEYGIEAGRFDGLTGVWIEPNSINPRKICAMGVRTSRWVSMHGLALNVNTDLSYFSNIIACGIEGKAVTSLEKELNMKINLKEVQDKLIKNLALVFDMKI